jgi:LPXTG-motif cell wall-anchored protein
MRSPGLARTLFAGGIVCSAVMLMPPAALGDVGITGVRPTAAAPGQSVDLEAGCGGRCGSRLAISLVPTSRAPVDSPCDRQDRARARRSGHVLPPNAICSPISRGLPRKPPYVFLGWALESDRSSVVKRYRLRFRVPPVTQGIYKFVIWIRPGGTLVSGGSLRVRQGQSAAASSGSGTDAVWFVAAGAAVVALAGAAVFLRRRRTV